ncbi:1298_t:CDS:2 [Diversispora eburnea]|uniref:1298_t:CDS:1 n=1 Tax=Diversispora eburnea TaxID=1213867 RepID=A0A9N8ZKC8_9GLOM|nr:1298_t:CDS:2 [Diversispora eburnea]
MEHEISLNTKVLDNTGMPEHRITLPNTEKLDKTGILDNTGIPDNTGLLDNLGMLKYWIALERRHTGNTGILDTG